MKSQHIVKLRRLVQKRCYQRYRFLKLSLLYQQFNKFLDKSIESIDHDSMISLSNMVLRTYKKALWYKNKLYGREYR